MTISHLPGTAQSVLRCCLAVFISAVVFAAGSGSPVQADQQPASIAFKNESASKRAPSAALRKKRGIPKITPNPYLSYLPVESRPNYELWRERMQDKDAVRSTFQKSVAQASGNMLALLPVGEAEAPTVRGVNDTQGTAQFVDGFGTGTGDDPAMDISGNLKTPDPATGFTPNAEDEGDIGKASDTTVADGQAKTASGTIGDGPFGTVVLTEVPIGSFEEDDGDIDLANATGLASNQVVVADGEIGDGPFGGTSGDFDVFAFSVTAPETIIIEVNHPAGDDSLDPIVALVGPTGNIQFMNDDGPFQTVESYLNVTFTCPSGNCGTQTYYAFVGGWSGEQSITEASFPSDPFDSSTGPGAGEVGPYELRISRFVVPSGDFDFYSVAASAGDLITVEVDTDGHGGVLDPIVAIYDSNGNMLALNDDDPNAPIDNFDSFLSIFAPQNDTYFIAVGGFDGNVFPTTALSFLEDPFDSSSGAASSLVSTGDYDIIVGRNHIDLDFYAFDLAAGDIIGVNANGAAPQVSLYDESGQLLIGSGFPIAGSFPTASPLPGGGNANAAYVVPEAGTYAVAVGFGDGTYDLEVRAFRPPQEATGTTQRLFIDFDGATVNTLKFGADPGHPQDSVLSPLVDFLPNWGLSAGDEDAVIDAILAVVEQNLSSDIRLTGNNPAFDIEILNSRDHDDPFGQPDVSRIIVGGTIGQSGISTIGIAESIDIGNFEQAEDSLVLLDLLSEVVGNENSLNTIALGTATKIQLIGEGVGNIVAHEAGHFFANFHTNRDNLIPSLMDTGGNLPGLVGVGDDDTFGSGDDVDVNFASDEYEPSEGLVGLEDTKNAIAFGLTAGQSSDLPYLVRVPDSNANGADDLAVLREGSNVVEIRDGQTGALLKNLTFFSDAFTPVTAVGLSDADGNGVAELAVLATRNSDGRTVAEIRNLSGAQLPRKVWFAADHSPVAMTVIEGDADNNGVPELAVLSVRDSDGRGKVEIMNAFGAANPQTVWAKSGFSVVDVEAIDDADGNGVPEVAILSTRDSDGRAKVEVQNAAGSANLAVRWFKTGNAAIDLAVVPDKDGNGVPEIAVLASRISDGRNVVEVMNASGPTMPSAVWFRAGFTALQVAAINDADGNTVPEVAVLASRNTDGKILVEIQNAAGPTNAKAVFYTTGYVAKNMVITDDIDNNGVEEAAVLMVRNSDGRIVVERSNTSGAPAPVKTFFSP